MRKVTLGMVFVLSVLFIFAAVSAQGELAKRVQSVPMVKVGRAALINGGSPGWTAPASMLFVVGTPDEDGFRFYLDYKLEDNARQWSYNNSIEVEAERESGDYGSRSWVSVWSDSRSRSKRYPWETYKEESSLTSAVVMQSSPVHRYRIFLTGTTNGDDHRLGGDDYYDKIVRQVVFVPKRGGKNLGATLASVMATRLLFEDGKRAFQTIGQGSDQSAMQTAIRNLHLNTLAFVPGMDWVLANTGEDYLSEAADLLAGKVKFAGGYFSAVFLLTELTQKAIQIATETTDDVNRLMTNECYRRSMGRVDSDGVVDGPDGMGSYRGYDLALDASDGAVRAILAYGYGEQDDWDVLDAELSAAAQKLQAAAGHFDGARLSFESAVGRNTCSFSLAGADNQSAAITRAQQFFDQQQVTIAGQLVAITALQTIGPGKKLAPPPRDRKKPRRDAGQDFKLAINALNDRPSPVIIRVQGFDSNSRQTYDERLSWAEDNNRYSTQTVILSGATIRVRLTFENDLWRAGQGPDGDRNGFIDYVATKERRYEAEAFSRSGGSGRNAGCHRRKVNDASLSGGGYADCGDGRDWIEIDLR